MWAYAEHLISGLRRVWLLTESIIKVDLPGLLSNEGNNCSLIVVAVPRWLHGELE